MIRKSTLKHIIFTDNGKILFEQILITLGMKTKGMFIKALIDEAKKICNVNHQMLTSADVQRVAEEAKVILKI